MHQLFTYFLLLICALVTFKYNKRFNIERQFHELVHSDLNNSVKIEIFDNKFKTLNWISPYYKNPNEELKRTTDYDISEVVGANAIGNVTQLKNELEVAKLQLISFTAGIANFGGIFGDLPPMLQLFNLGLIALGTYMVFTIGRTLAQSIANRVLAKSFDKLEGSQHYFLMLHYFLKNFPKLM